MNKRKRSSLGHFYGEGSTGSHLENLSQFSIKSTSGSSLIGSSRQTPRRSARFHPSEKLKSEFSSQLPNFRNKSVKIDSQSPSISKSKQKVSYRTTPQGVSVKSQLNLSRSNFSGEHEGAQNGCRRSLRLAYEARTAAFECPQQNPDVNGRRRSPRLLGIAPVSYEDVKQDIRNSKTRNAVVHKKLLEVDRKTVRQSRRLLGIAPASYEDVKQDLRNSKARNAVEHKKLLEVDYKIESSLILRRSTRLISIAARDGKELNESKALSKSNIDTSTKKECVSMPFHIQMSSHRPTTASNEVTNGGVSSNITDKEKIVERLNADCGDLVLERRTGDAFFSIKIDEIHRDGIKLEEDNGMRNMSKKIDNADFHVSVAWTNEQEEALQKAYILAKPSPHFWKKVSRMVPGKSAQDCFDKIHSSIETPLPPQLRPKVPRKSLSPICDFNLEAGRLGRNRTTRLAAQKTVRHLLRKHRLADQETTIDRFSLLEYSPITLTSNVPDSPESSSSTSNSPSLLPQTGEKQPSNSKMLSRFKQLTSPNDPSPQVLKKIKNRALHDRYIDQLHLREARRVMLAKKISSGGVYKSERGDLRAARTALISDAVSFISHFREAPANPVHELEECEHDDYHGDDDDDVDDAGEWNDKYC